MNNPATEATNAIEAIDALMSAVPKPNVTADAGEITLTQSRARIGDIVRAAGVRHQRTAITDHGERVALLVHPADWENLTDALAVARSALARINGTAGEPLGSDEARRRILGEHAA